MFHALSGIACFVTVTVSFLYGTRICWVSGKKCHFREEPDSKKKVLNGNLPAAIAVYSFGFLVIFSTLTNGFLTIVVSSLTSAILLANLVISMAMPELKRKPSPPWRQES